MFLFQVLENGKPCDETGFPRLVGYGWTRSIFHSLEEAREHAKKWLGSGWGYLAEKLEVNVPLDYSYGDTIEIRRLDALCPNCEQWWAAATRLESLLRRRNKSEGA